jgi:pyruvate kinase
MYTATKIIATVGPASSDSSAIARLIRAGVNIFRLNFAHGDFKTHGRVIQTIRGESHRLGISVGILQDLPGPKIRLGTLPEGGIDFRRGARVILCCAGKAVYPDEVPVQYSAFCKDVKPGNHIYIDDGAVRLEAKKVIGPRVFCEVEIGGTVTSHKGINLPGVKISAPTFTRFDKECAEFGIRHKVDFMALSFVRNAVDIKALLKFVENRNGDQFIIAKIEKREAIDDFDNILSYTDGVMVARGDLGIELPIEQVPGIQKDLIHRCNRAGVPVITATQVLESMTTSPRPTRAEATDAANAVLDGTDALMLSGETAVGHYPVEAVKTLKAIAGATEQGLRPKLLRRGDFHDGGDVASALARAVCESAIDLGIKLIAAPTRSGHTARLISRFRPTSRIIAFSQYHSTRMHLLLSWGVESFAIDHRLPFDELLARIKARLLEEKLASRNERIIVTAGSPNSIAGETNLMVVERI